MKELWKLLISAQNNINGVPQEFLDKEREHLLKQKVRICMALNLINIIIIHIF